MDETLWEVREVVVRMDERLRGLESRLVDLASGPGSGQRCVEQRERLEFLESRFKSLEGRIWWAASAIAMGMLMLGLRSFWKLVTV